LVKVYHSVEKLWKTLTTIFSDVSYIMKIMFYILFWPNETTMDTALRRRRYERTLTSNYDDKTQFHIPSYI